MPGQIGLPPPFLLSLVMTESGNQVLHGQWMRHQDILPDLPIMSWIRPEKDGAWRLEREFLSVIHNQQQWWSRENPLL